MPKEPPPEPLGAAEAQPRAADVAGPQPGTGAAALPAPLEGRGAGGAEASDMAFRELARPGQQLQGQGQECTSAVPPEKEGEEEGEGDLAGPESVEQAAVQAAPPPPGGPLTSVFRALCEAGVDRWAPAVLFYFAGRLEGRRALCAAAGRPAFIPWSPAAAACCAQRSSFLPHPSLPPARLQGPARLCTHCWAVRAWRAATQGRGPRPQRPALVALPPPCSIPCAS